MTYRSAEFEAVRDRLADGSVRSAFDYLVAHALAAGFVLVPKTGAVPSVELQLPARRRNPFSLQTHKGHVNFYFRKPVLSEHEGLFQAAVVRFGPVKENSLREYRTHIHGVREAEAMLAFLRAHGAWPGERHSSRFVTESLEPVTAAHLLAAARAIVDGTTVNSYGPSTDFDVLFEGRRLPPKAVFGLAATSALGFPVQPANFRGGENTPCFRVLRANGFRIVRKDEGEEEREDPALVSDEDRVWAEGQPRLVSHLRRERGSGLAAAKREAFKARHGRLVCERCGMDPVEVFGSESGEACIEVHHGTTAVADMAPGHRTRLEDLECLCANCHRVVHREMKIASFEGRRL